MNSYCVTSPHETSDLLVFSHLRWDFIFQRPQQLMSRFASQRRVFYFEDPIQGLCESAHFQWKRTPENVQVVTPYVPTEMSQDDIKETLETMINDFILEEGICDYTLWYYSPMPLTYTRHLTPAKTIYDCMDELCLFKETPENIIQMENELINRSDLVFTAGQSIFQAKKNEHSNIHLMPNHIDSVHFSKARELLVEPEDQVNIPYPRIGFYGVVDERIDMDLILMAAELKPEHQFIFVGPVMLHDMSQLPLAPNIHFLGKKDYHALPLYISGWDCAIMPFTLGGSTWHIHTEKVLELLSAHKTVVSTPVDDVIYPFGGTKLVRIAKNAQQFVESLDAAMYERSHDPAWPQRVDEFLTENSWEAIHEKMGKLEAQILKKQELIRGALENHAII